MKAEQILQALRGGNRFSAQSAAGEKKLAASSELSEWLPSGAS